MPSLARNASFPGAQSRLAVSIDARGPSRSTVQQPGAVCDPVIERHNQTAESGRAQLAGQPAMSFVLRLFERVPRALCPMQIAFSSRIAHGDVAVARPSESRIQPANFAVDPGPLSVASHGREEKDDGTEPRKLYSHIVNGIGIARNGRLAIIPDQMNAALRDLLKRSLAVEQGWRGVVQ